jgi:hypothetical protein
MKVSAPEYPQFLAALKATIRQRQYQALRAVNHELLALYLEIGEAIYRKQEELGWGKSVVETLARDLQTEFPGRNGFSARNLWNMRDLYFSYRDLQKLQPLVAEISSAKNLVILAPCNDLLLPKLDSKYQLTPARKIIAERIKTQKMILPRQRDERPVSSVECRVCRVEGSLQLQLSSFRSPQLRRSPLSLSLSLFPLTLLLAAAFAPNQILVSLARPLHL